MSEFADLLNNYVKEKGFSDQDLANMVEKYAKENNIELNCGKNSGINREMFHYWRKHLKSAKRNENCNVVHILVKILELNSEEGERFLDAADCGKLEPSFTTKPCLTTKTPLVKIKFIKYLLDKFYLAHPYPIILLSQQDFPLIDNYIGSVIIEHYADERYSFVRLPDYADENSFYIELGKLFGFGYKISNSTDFRNAFIHKIKQNETPYFCFISSFEELSPDSRKTLAAILRSIHTECHKQLHLILFGREQLEELSRADNVYSLLNDAIISYWPEWNYEDIQLFYKSDSHADLSSEIAQYFLEITGGHLKLLNRCFKWYQQDKLEIENFPDQLIQTGEIQDLFMPFIQTENHIKILKKYLSEHKVANQTILRNEFLKKLYWKNLLVKREDGFYWRCETIQNAGKKSLVDFQSQDNT
jgi:hypothetical protein